VAAGSGCVVHDFTRDGFVDLADAAAFQRYFSGEGNPASIACRRAGSYAHDADGDRDVDIDDYLSYESCLTTPPGPGAPGAAVCLAIHDFDGAGRSDGDVDLDDFGGLLICFRGAGQTPPPECFRPAPAGVPPGSGSFALHGGMVDVLTSGRSGPDGALSLQYSRARYFDLKHGRFLQRDPKGYIDGGNLYEAFGSNPARFRDPMGTQYEDDGLLAAIRRYLTGDGWMEQVSDRMGITADPNPMRQLVYEQVDQRLIYPLAETANRAEPVVTRVAGGMRAAEGGAEFTVGVIIIVKTGGVAGVAGGGALSLHGVDSFQAGTRQMIWGEVTPTETYSLFADAGYPTLAFAVDTAPSVVAAVGIPALALERASAAPALTVSHVAGQSARPVSVSSRVLAAVERGYQRVVVVVFDAEPGDVILGSGLSPGRISATRREEQLLFSFMKPAQQTSGSGNIVVSRGGHVLDLAGTTWRQAAFEDGGLVYLLRDANTEQILKVGQTTPQTFTGRFKAYVSASQKTGRVLEVEVFEVPAEMRGLIEGQFRQHLGATPGGLPWDNTGGRLGRTGQGIPPGPVSTEWHVR